MEAHPATLALKDLLFQTVAQTVQDRFLRIAQSKAWPYLACNPKDKRMILMMTEKNPISTQSTQSLIDELVEIASHGESMLRFKSLKPENKDGTSSPVSPWLIQLNPRKDRLFGILSLLTASSVWVLVVGRLQPHTNNENTPP